MYSGMYARCTYLLNYNWTRTQNHLVRKRTLNHLVKWLTVRLRTKWFWVRVQLQLVNFHKIKILCKLLSVSAIPVHISTEVGRIDIHHALSQEKIVLFMLTICIPTCLLFCFRFWLYLFCLITSKSSVQDLSPKICNP